MNTTAEPDQLLVAYGNVRSGKSVYMKHIPFQLKDTIADFYKEMFVLGSRVTRSEAWIETQRICDAAGWSDECSS